MKSITLIFIACGSVAAAGCGQKGPLYLPDKNASVVTRPAGSAPQPSSSPASQTPSPKQDKNNDDSQSTNSQPRS